MAHKLKTLVERDVFALLVAVTSSGDVILRPIGGRYGESIVRAVEEVNGKYPDSRMKLFCQNYEYDKYFKDIVAQERVFPWAALEKEQLAEILKHRKRLDREGGEE